MRHKVKTFVATRRPSQFRIQRTPMGNWTINGRMYPDYQSAEVELNRLSALVERAKRRKQVPLIRNWDLEKKLKGGTKSAHQRNPSH